MFQEGYFGVSRDKVNAALETLRLAIGEERAEVPIATVLDTYRAVKKGKHKESGWTTIQGRLRAIVRELGGERNVLALSYDDADDYIARRMSRDGVARATAGLELQALSTAINVSVKRRRLPYNPLAGYEFDLQHGSRDRIFTEAEIDELLPAARRIEAWEVHAVIAVMRNTGIRPKELYTSARASLNWSTGALWIPEDVAKTKVARVCVVWPEGLEALRMLRADPTWLFPSPKFKGRHIRYTMLNDQWQRVVDVSCIDWNKDGRRPELYSLRGTLATRLALEEGYEISQLMAAMGWVHAGQAQAYVRAGERQMLEAAAKLQAKRPQKIKPVAARPMAKALPPGPTVTDIAATKLTKGNKKV